jgi:hypothetical protein
MSVATIDTTRWLRIGFLGDGLFKVILGVVYSAAVASISTALDVDAWLIFATAGPLFLSGAAEIIFALRSAAPSHTKYLVGYDSGWIVVTVIVAAVMSSGGALWFGYQAIASAVLAIAFALGAARADHAGGVT